MLYDIPSNFFYQGVYTSTDLDVALCFLCGSGGRETLVNCLACAQTAHQYCITQVYFQFAPIR